MFVVGLIVAIALMIARSAKPGEPPPGPARKSPTRVPQIFAGDGKGNFTLLTRYTFPRIAFDYGDVAVADFDGDASLGIALASHLQRIAVLLRRGDAFETTGATS